MDDTRITASLPPLPAAGAPRIDVEITHRREPGAAAGETAEVMTISLRASPSLDAAAGHFLPGLAPLALLGWSGTGGPAGAWPLPASPVALPRLGASPMEMWAEMLRLAWAPWLQMMGMAGGGGPKR